MTLNDTKIGDILIVTEFIHKGNEVTKLTAMGIFPGVRLQMVQKKPLPVFKIGFSMFVIDKDLASLVIVEICQD